MPGSGRTSLLSHALRQAAQAHVQGQGHGQGQVRGHANPPGYAHPTGHTRSSGHAQADDWERSDDGAIAVADPVSPPEPTGEFDNIGRYETGSSYDLGASGDGEMPPVDPLRWTMVQDVLQALGGPIDEKALSDAAQPIAAESAAALPARDPIDYDDPPAEPFVRFDGTPLPPDPVRTGKAAPKPPPGPAAGMVTVWILSIVAAVLGIWIVIDFFTAL